MTDEYALDPYWKPAEPEPAPVFDDDPIDGVDPDAAARMYWFDCFPKAIREKMAELGENFDPEAVYQYYVENGRRVPYTLVELVYYDWYMSEDPLKHLWPVPIHPDTWEARHGNYQQNAFDAIMRMF